MGRKSAKGKEKKMKRKEESAKMAISLAKVEAANKIENPLSMLEPFKKFERNGVSLVIDFKRSGDMDDETKEFVFQLCKKNMQTLYEKCGVHGWKDREKREEMSEERALYLIVRNKDGEPVAFVHFRFDMEYDEEVLYCYEIQLTEPLRRKGLGKFLMQILELLAYKTEMTKVMLTVFKANDSAVTFFMEALKYEIDDISPDDGMYEEEARYWILSKPIKRKTPAQNPGANGHGVDAKLNGHAHSHIHTGSCCH
ncbi:N-alpha-acetyltransferase 40-like [Ruditapes philippinarum]|uniref:N-alpha-acetyltransferase 40-like n=1 Tax=Ruditapes philippinarum TaxID=129788 RepID=UPI00295A65EC|nr:N-alpha-acetyltransferase 40-like [Ruditapes philippinarum]